MVAPTKLDLIVANGGKTLAMDLTMRRRETRCTSVPR